MSPQSHLLVFVAGLHRSGTTPLARLLAGHPAVSGLTGTGVKEDEGQHLQDVYAPANTYGGPGRFAFDPKAHLTESSPLATQANADRLFTQWSAYWDLSRPVLVEKSPPNLVMTRFLQKLYPDAHFLVVVRHPVVVALATSKWTRGTSLRRLLEHWLAAHETFLADAGHLRCVHVIKYEHLIAQPERTLTALANFLNLKGPIPADGLKRDRSAEYQRRWAHMRSSRSLWRRLALNRVEEELGPRIRRFGYLLDNLVDADPFPPVAARPYGLPG